MNLAFLCVMIACLMPLTLTLLAKAGGVRGGRRYDNRNPRYYLAQLEGWPQRANWAQQNSWEALPLFIAGVVLATLAGVAQEVVDTWAIVFIAARLAYAACYLLDQASLRSVVWAVGAFSCFRLMWAAL